MPRTKGRIILIADDRPDHCARIQSLFPSEEYTVAAFNSGVSALEHFYARPPNCVIVRHGMHAGNNGPLLSAIKSDNVYGHLPVIVVVSDSDLESGIDWVNVPADDYIIEPFTQTQILARVAICWARAQRDVNANPLTGLPGNPTIVREVERRIKEGVPFAFAYMDLDSFKAFNDKYGFSRGDEVIRLAARIMVNTLQAGEPMDTVVGHIGGDDFAFIAPPDSVQASCEAILHRFDAIVRDFYDADDRDAGLIHSTDRQGNPKDYPLMTVSIAVIDSSVTQIGHPAELFGKVAEVKALVKRLPGSNYLLDRRK